MDKTGIWHKHNTDDGTEEEKELLDNYKILQYGYYSDPDKEKYQGCLEWRIKMKYLKQFLVIILVSFAGEILKEVIPFPVPASIYGMIILFTCLSLGIIKEEQVSGASNFLVEIMPVMFIPAAAGLIDSWGILKPVLLPVSVITVVSTIVVMAASGRATQFVLKHKKNG